MSNKRSDHSKKWLISRLKTSGSKKKYVESDDYANTRNAKKSQISDELPKHESMGKSRQFANGKINYGLLIRFLRGRIGDNWLEIHEEILERIPTNLSEYRSCIEWFVADLIEEDENGLWDKRDQKYLKLDPNEVADPDYFTFKEFYVNPKSNLLTKIADAPSSKVVKGMTKDELRAFRECQQQVRLEQRRSKKAKNIRVNITDEHAEN